MRSPVRFLLPFLAMLPTLPTPAGADVKTREQLQAEVTEDFVSNAAIRISTLRTFFTNLLDSLAASALTDTTTAANVAVGPLTTGVTARSVLARAGDVANVLDYVSAGDTDYAPAFRKAVATGQPVYAPYLSAGYHINTKVDLAPGTRVTFTEGQIIYSSTTDEVFRFIGTDSPFTGQYVQSGIFGHPVFSMSTAGSSSTAVLLGTAAGRVGNVSLIYDCRFCYSALKDETGSFFAYELTIDINSYDTKGRSILLNHTEGEVRFKAHITEIGSVAQWESIRILQIAGLDIEGIEITDNNDGDFYDGYAVVIANNDISRVASVYQKGRILIDGGHRNGLLLQNMQNWHSNGNVIDAYSSLGRGFMAQNSIKNEFNIHVFGRNGDAKSPSYNNAEISGGGQNKIEMFSEYSAAAGLSLHDTTDNTVFGYSTSDNATIGISEDGTSDRNFITGNLSGGTYSWSTSGADSKVCNYIGKDQHFHSGCSSGTGS